MKESEKQSVESMAEFLENLFPEAKPLDRGDISRLQKFSESLEWDTEFQSSSLKGQFVSMVLSEMHKRNVTQSELARRWKKSRQYINKILNEDKRINYTIETIVEVALILRKKVELHFVDIDKPLALITNIQIKKFTLTGVATPLNETNCDILKDNYEEERKSIGYHQFEGMAELTTSISS